MTAEEFSELFKNEIGGLLSRVTRRYSVTYEEMALTLHGSAKKYLGETSTDRETPAPGASGTDSSHKPGSSITELIKSINCDDLCLAIACAKGDDAAWEDFFRDYRSYLVSIARSVTPDPGRAEQLADSTFAELYGLRESSGTRVSKFSFYSGRGSLRGWLRAVVYQLSADMYRKTGRLVQTDEAEDMEHIPAPPNGHSEGVFEDERYRPAVGEALRKAILELDSKERLLLAHYYYDEMTLREIGKLFGVHEATICRWLGKIQKRTRKLVEKSLLRDHHFNRRQVAEALEMAATSTEITVGDHLLESVASDAKSADNAKCSEEPALSLRLD
ncbi:MAG TPA: sigma-70 family RNA polymerase sigma factor [Blastocatellia bacterium]|nr:sigma-70 family RNA polymerase sigma factor [Blastocatellia bacterium]